MLLSCMNQRISIVVFRSIKKIVPSLSLTKEQFHTTKSVYNNEDESKKEPDSNEKSMAAERRRKLRAKFGNMQFISIDQKPQENLKPKLDYESFIKSESKRQETKEKSAKAKIFEQPKHHEEKKPQSHKIEFSKEKISNLIDLKAILKEVKAGVQKKPKIETKVDDPNQLVLTEEDFMLKKKSKVSRGSPYQMYHDIKSGAGLSIFSVIKEKKTRQPPTQESPIFYMYREEEFKLAQELPYKNGFDEMIKLTDEGILWKFPIDNEQGLEELEDAKTSFHEHIFLDHHLARFPKIEAIQQFMTLVLNGLSKNGFITLKEKLEVIEWYRNYFAKNMDLINEALQDEQKEKEFKESLKKDQRQNLIS